jgi:hypothetical protein
MDVIAVRLMIVKSEYKSELEWKQELEIDDVRGGKFVVI